MRILWAMDFDIGDLAGGGDVVSTKILSEGLREMGHVVDLHNPEWSGRVPWYMERVMTSGKFVRRLRTILKDKPPSIVIAQNHVFPYVVRETRRLNIPTVVVCRDVGYRCPQSTQSSCSRSCAMCIGKMALIPYPWFRHHVNMKRKYLPLADGWIVNSEYLAQDMINWFPTTRPTVIYPPMDNSHKPAPRNRDSILFMGAGKYKGADIALKLAQYFEWKYEFKVCGNQEPEQYHGFKRLVNVELCGFVPRSIAFEGVRILIAPGRWAEPFGRAIAEAGWLGIPSIVTDRGGMAEAVGPGGLLIDRPDDLDSWIDAIEFLMDNKDNSMLASYSTVARSWSKKFWARTQLYKLEKYLKGVIHG